MKSKVIIIFLLFIFSMILWSFVTLSEEYSTQITSPISIKTNSSFQKVSSITPTEVNFTIKGKGWQLLKFIFGFNESFKVQLNTVEEINKVNIRNYLKYNPWLTNSIQVISIEPEVISIKAEKAFTKVVPVIADLDLKFKDGYGLVSDIYINPDSINIYGPWSKTVLIQGVKTEKIILKDLEENVSITAKLIKPQFINFLSDEAEIKFEVEKIVDKQISGVEISIINLPPNKEILLSSEKLDLVLKGGIQKLANLKPDNIQAKIDYNDAENDSLGFLIPEIILPSKVELIEMKPPKLKYIIKQN